MINRSAAIDEVLEEPESICDTTEQSESDVYTPLIFHDSLRIMNRLQ